MDQQQLPVVAHTAASLTTLLERQLRLTPSVNLSEMAESAGILGTAETEAQEVLDGMIPEEHHESGDDSIAGTMSAAASYIEALEEEIGSLRNAADSQRAQSQVLGNSIVTAITPQWVIDIQAVSNLRQAANRLRQKVDEKVLAEGGLVGEVKTLVEQAYDVLVDMTDAVEQGNLSAAKKAEWAKMQQDMGRKFYLQ